MRARAAISEPVEVFEYQFIDGREMLWDVSRAKALLATGQGLRTTVAMTAEALRDTCERNQINPEKLRAADTSQPGIGAPVRYAGVDFYLLIDGTHRAAKALLTGRTFEVRLLTDEAARACLLCASPGLTPWEHAADDSRL